jgi:hypothetical protein
MSIDFERPWLLLLLPLCVGLVYVLWRSSHTYMPPVRRRASLILRVAVTTLLCLVLSSPTLQLRADQLAVAILLDRSDSITPGGAHRTGALAGRAMAAKGA